MTGKVLMPEAFRAGAEAAAMSPARIAGDLIFLTGVTGSGPDGSMPVGIEAQTDAVFDKIAGVLAEAGLTLDAMVEMTSYHVGLRTHFDAFDQIRRARLSAPYPAWTAVEVAGLRRVGAMVELRAVAHRG